MMRFSGAGVSDVGPVRDHNEDAAFVAPYVCVVADGVGGAAAGEVASATTAYVVSAWALARFGQPAAPLLRDAVAAARAGLRAGVEAAPERAGMATTMTAIVSDGERVVLGHLGDSRAYRWRDGVLEQVSRDHSFVQDMVDVGRLTEAEAEVHSWRNVVMRSVDASPDGTEPDVVDLDARVGDRLLLCSDGLTDYLPRERIQGLVRLQEPRAAARLLVHEAIRAGSKDNVTVVVVDVIDGPRVNGDGHVLGALVDPANVVDPASVRTPTG